MRLTLADVAAWTGGQLVGAGSTLVPSVSIDSRTLRPGECFVAVRARRDGHEFMGDAFARGAGSFLVEQIPDGFSPVDAVVVSDTVVALGHLASSALERLRAERARSARGGPDVIAVTGSAGKTSTKDLVAAVLGRSRSVCASPASFNNELGVPLTLLRAETGTDTLVLEMGARGPGHIAGLCEIAPPRVGVVTTIAAAHLEFYDSVGAIADEKATILEDAELAVVSTDHRWVDRLVARASGTVIRVGRRTDDDVSIAGLRLDAELRPSFDLHTPWGSGRVGLEVRGAHQASNAAIAATVGLALGERFPDVVEALAGAQTSRWRMQVTRSGTGVTVVNDAYNANPASTAAALDALAALHVDGQRWAVLGAMAELGEHSEEEHRRIGRLAAARGVTHVVVVGLQAALAEGAREVEATHVYEVADAHEAAAVLSANVRPGDAVLVKASRVVGLERVAAALLGDEGDHA